MGGRTRVRKRVVIALVTARNHAHGVMTRQSQIVEAICPDEAHYDGSGL